MQHVPRVSLDTQLDEQDLRVVRLLLDLGPEEEAITSKVGRACEYVQSRLHCTCGSLLLCMLL